MKLAKELLVGTLIISMAALSGCGKEDTPKTEETLASETVVPSESPKEVDTTTSEASPEETQEVSEQSSEESVESTSADESKATEEKPEEIPIESEEYAGLEELEGETYRTKIPEGWKSGGSTTVNASVEGYNIISNSDLNSEIVITEQVLEGADTIDMGAYMKDHKEAYNEESESTGVYVLSAGDKELDAVKVGYMKCEIKITEQMVKNAITIGSVTQEEVDAAGGMEAYIASQNKKQLQIYVPNRNHMITIATQLEEENEAAIEEAAYALANIMYLK